MLKVLLLNQFEGGLATVEAETCFRPAIERFGMGGIVSLPSEGPLRAENMAVDKPTSGNQQSS